MTGHGEARGEAAGLRLAVDVRSVNNRHFKLTLRAAEPYHLLESECDRVVRRFVRRGAVMVHLLVERPASAQDFPIDAIALRSYIEQVRAVCASLSPPVNPESVLAQVLALPGVAPESGEQRTSADEDWPVIEPVLVAALERLQEFRRREGERMASELLNHHAELSARLAEVRARLPVAVASLRDRLLDRVRGLLAEAGVAAEPGDVLREAAIAAERSDVAEEVVRLSSHLEQFESIVRTDSEGPGRKIEFIVQEMGREVNTIGSKAGDVAIARHVVEMKATLEKVRELIQNVE
jgi:uncharacterized protein (TIGR00255 family)